MPQIQWNAELSVGVEMIDTQHKELIRIANVLIKSVSLGLDRNVVDDTIKKLREYTVYHFSCEEELMEEIRYPGRSDQVVEHNRLKAEVKAYQRQLYLQEDITAEDILDFVKGWLLDHILNFDRDLARFIHAKEARESEEIREIGAEEETDSSNG